MGIKKIQRKVYLMNRADNLELWAVIAGLESRGIDDYAQKLKRIASNMVEQDA